MKDQNFIVKFKNSFTRQDMQKVTVNNPIIKDSLSDIANKQLSSLVQLYTRDAFQNGFNPYLAFRIIVLFCYSFGEDADNNKVYQNFNLTQQTNRFLTHHLDEKCLQNIQHCLDLLLIDEVRHKLPLCYYKLYKIKVLSCLNKYYSSHKQPINRKRSTRTLRQLCKQSLKVQSIKHTQEIYCQILDILLQLQTRQFSIKLRKRKRFQALQLVNNKIRYLQNTQFSLSQIKYQYQLMESYYLSAQLHYELHYIAYTKKYCEIVINIAKRLQQGKSKYIKQLAQELLQKVMI